MKNGEFTQQTHHQKNTSQQCEFVTRHTHTHTHTTMPRFALPRLASLHLAFSLSCGSEIDAKYIMRNVVFCFSFSWLFKYLSKLFKLCEIFKLWRKHCVFFSKVVRLFASGNFGNSWLLFQRNEWKSEKG